MITSRRLNMAHTPVVTITLLFLIWAVEIFARVGGADQREELIANFGLNFSHGLTYLTYPFIHADPGHIMQNTVGLLLYGWLVELQMKPKWLLVCILTSTLVGATGPAILFVFTGIETIGVGLSTVTGAMSVLWISILARYCKPRNIRIADDRILQRVVLAWLVIYLLIDVCAYGWLNYTVAGHFSGALAGAVMMVFVLRPRTPSAECAWLMEGTQSTLFRIKNARRSLAQDWANRNHAGQMLEGLFVTMVIAGLITTLHTLV